MRFRFRVHVPLVAILAIWAGLACNRGETSRQKGVDPRDAKLAQLEKETQRLTDELRAAQESSAALDATLHNAEKELAALVGLDTRISGLQKEIEGGANSGSVQTSGARIGKLIKKLRAALGERRKATDRARTSLDAAKQQIASQPDTAVKEAYLRQIERIEALLTQQIAENARLTKERDSYEQLYRSAIEEAEEARKEAETARGEADVERQLREEAERLQNRVFVIVAKKGDLRQKGILTGRWYQRKSSNCACDGCLEEHDRRTLESIPVPGVITRVKLYSSHPAKSFRLVPNGPSASLIEIVDSETFWSGSHCLVIGY